MHKKVTANERKALSLVEQKGSSSWLSTLPVEENGKANEVEHALSCCKGGHVIRQHNETRVVNASLLGEVTRPKMSRSNHHFSHSQEKYYEAGVRAWKLQPEWMYSALVSGMHSKTHVWM